MEPPRPHRSRICNGIIAGSLHAGSRRSPSRFATPSVTPDVGAVPVIAPSLKGKLGKAGGGGSGGPTPIEQLQVTLYRCFLIFSALSCWTVYALDFFMTSGIDFIDPGWQKSVLEFGDLTAGLAALVVPTGSLILVGILLKAIGFATVVSVLAGGAGAAKVGSLLGPLSCLLLCGREVYWFGLSYKLDATFSAALWIVVLVLRGSLVTSGIESQPMSADISTGTDGRDLSLLRENELQWLSRWQELELPPYSGSVPPVGPPLLVSVPLSASMTVLALGKLLQPISEDLDEEGEQFMKPSSVGVLDEDTQRKYADEDASAD